jgi:hypothetical protein
MNEILRIYYFPRIRILNKIAKMARCESANKGKKTGSGKVKGEKSSQIIYDAIDFPSRDDILII